MIDTSVLEQRFCFGFHLYFQALHLGLQLLQPLFLRNCIGQGNCECGGGALGRAPICPVEGYYLLTPSSPGANVSGANGRDSSAWALFR